MSTDESLHITAKTVADADPELMARMENVENRAAVLSAHVERLDTFYENAQTEM